MGSLRGRLFAVWMLLLVAAAALGIVIYAFYRQTTAVQEARSADTVAHYCTTIADHVARSPGGVAQAAAGDRRLTALVSAALAEAPGVEGGLWMAGRDSLAYAYPTYPGTGPKTDVPAAELSSIRDINESARRDRTVALLRSPSATQILLLAACPVGAAAPQVTAWTMTRLYTGQGGAYQNLMLGLALLAGVVVLTAVLLGRTIWTWSQRIAGLEADLASEHEEGDLPLLRRTGERELDRLVSALNATRLRLAEARGRTAAAERYAVAGRLTSGIAHEIRNPIAAMRLKAENAVASRLPERKDEALRTILDQINRLDRLLRDLLTMTQRGEPERAPTDIDALLARSLDAVRDRAAEAGVKLTAEDGTGKRGAAHVDGDQLTRAVVNLLVNAIQNTSPGGAVTIETPHREDALVFRVSNRGAMIDPRIADRLFEPFVTGRSGGTGLGLAIVSEIARGHGGRVALVSESDPVVFQLEVPWHQPRS